MSILIIGLSFLYTVCGHAPEHRNPDYADSMQSMAGSRVIRWPTFSASTGKVVDLQTAKSYIWRMALNGSSSIDIIDGFMSQGVALAPEMVSVIRQLTAIKLIDTKYLDFAIGKILERAPDYRTRPFGAVLKQALRHPSRHLRLFLNFCVDQQTLINNCPVEIEIPMTFGDPVKVYVMPNSVYRNMLKKIGRVLLMDRFVGTNPMY